MTRLELGLPIVRSIVERHNGRICGGPGTELRADQNAEGGGAAFRAAFRLADT